MIPHNNPPPSARGNNGNRPEAREQAERPGSLELSRRLEALAHLSSEVAHDVNNALQVIKTAVEVLRRRLPPADGDVAAIVDMLARNSERATSLIQRLAVFSRMSENATSPDAAGRLAGLRVLVVEHESRAGKLVEDQLAQLGCRITGPIAGVEKALALVGSEEIDMALLDGDLGDEPVYPVAEALQARGIPFVFMSGSGGLAKPWRSRPVIQKPFELVQLRGVIEFALGGRP